MRLPRGWSEGPSGTLVARLSRLDRARMHLARWLISLAGRILPWGIRLRATVEHLLPDDGETVQ